MSRGGLITRSLNALAQRWGPAGHAQSGGLSILAYHRVLDGFDGDVAWFDETLVSALVDEFREQMRFVKARFEVLSFAKLADWLGRASRDPRPAVMITFDDGYRDSYQVVYPILCELAIPATMFLATGYVETGEVFWWDKVVYLINHARRSSLLFPSRPPVSFSLRTREDRARTAQRVLSLLKRIPDEARLRILEALPAMAGAALDPEVARRLTLRWSEIETMSRDGIEFGSHTVTHPVLTQAPADLLQYEIGTSKQVIEERTGKPVTAFCYPMGGKLSFNETVQAVVRRNGYRFAVSYRQGSNPLPPADRLALRRFRIERGQPLDAFIDKLLPPGRRA